MTSTLTKQQVRKMTSRPRDFRNMRSKLHDWENTGYTPSQMAELGVKHGAIIRAFLRPEVLGDAFGDAVCKIAEEVLPAFEAARPGDTGPRDAIEAARTCFASPTPANRADADRAARAAAQAAAAAAATAAAEPWAEALAASWAASAAADMEWAADAAAADAARSAVVAGCPRATIRSIIEGARI